MTEDVELDRKKPVEKDPGDTTPVPLDPGAPTDPHPPVRPTV